MISKNPFLTRQDRYEIAEKKCKELFEDEVKLRIGRLSKISMLRYGISIDRVEIHFNLREKNVAGTGRAIFDGKICSGIIRLNPIFMLENQQDMLEDTVPHEMAHVTTSAAFREERPPAHGRRWKEVVTHFGLDPKKTRCHNYDTKNT